MEDKSQTDGRNALILSIIFIGLVWANKAYPKLLLWLQPIEHRVLLIGIALVPVSILTCRIIASIKKNFARVKFENGILGKEKGSVFCGNTIKGEEVFIKTRQRGMHTQVIGTTNAGKTESVILPWAIQDIQQGRGLILIDGKADRSLLDKLFAYTIKANRQNDFRLFSISNVNESFQFNPLIGGTTEEIAERVFNAFEFDNPYYRSVQFEIFGQVLRIFEQGKMIPTFPRLHEAISQPNRLSAFKKLLDPAQKSWLTEFLKLDSRERDKRTSGLTAALSHFAFGKTAQLFNTESPSIDLKESLKEQQIVYFQLPVLLSPFLGKATGKLVLQALQSAVAGRHNEKSNEVPPFYSVFLDDFTEYLYPGFVSVLNKTRSANIGVVFAHQALGDIKTLGEPIANSILTNSNLKIFMRGSDPESAEYFSRVIGTKEAMKFTERTRSGLVGRNFTGDSSAREVEEFVVHPNRFKSSLGVGEAVVVVPHEQGSKSFHMKFKRYPDIERQPLTSVVKNVVPGLPEKPKRQKKEKKTCKLNF